MWGLVIGALAAIATKIASYFSAEAQLGRIKLEQAADKARQEVEAERLKSTYVRIEHEPAHSVDEVLARLNKK